MNQSDKAHAFAKLHQLGNPILLYNIWDAGSAKAIAGAGAQAIATGSWSVAAAQGYPDGEAIPIDLLLQIVARITATVDLPVTVDFEGGYAAAPEDVAANVARLIEAGAIGINFEDQIIGGTGLHAIELQTSRIATVRYAAAIPLFINARTDLFLKQKDRGKHAGLIAEAIERATAYGEAGASGFFVPGLVDAELIGGICQAVSLPVNIMRRDDAPSNSELAALGVARISYGPGPYFQATRNLEDWFREATGTASTGQVGPSSSL